MSRFYLDECIVGQWKEESCNCETRRKRLKGRFGVTQQVSNLAGMKERNPAIATSYPVSTFVNKFTYIQYSKKFHKTLKRTFK